MADPAPHWTPSLFFQALCPRYSAARSWPTQKRGAAAGHAEPYPGPGRFDRAPISADGDDFVKS